MSKFLTLCTSAPALKYSLLNRPGDAPTNTHGALYSETVSSYAQQSARLLLMILRSSHSQVRGYPITLHPTHRFAANKLSQALSRGDEEEILESIHALLYSLFEFVPDGTDSDRYRCPVLRYLVLACLSEEGDIKPPKDITPIVSRIQWCIRSTVLFDALRKATTDQGANSLET